VLVERFVEGREIHVAVLGGRVLGAAEVVSGRAIFDFAARSGAASVLLPPRLSPERLRGVATLAERAARAVDASGLVEVDLVVTERGNEYLLEVDTLPSLAPHSLALRIARASGLDLPTLVDALVRQARLHARRRPGPLHASGPAGSGLERRMPSEPH
jgi:D-alanine-D-alanine ligase